MFEIVGSKSRFCDGVSRREFVRIGSIGLGALALPERRGLISELI